MLLTEYLSKKEQKKRILIVSNQNRANMAIRQYEAEAGEKVLNTNCFTLEQMAKEIYVYKQTWDFNIDEVVKKREKTRNTNKEYEIDETVDSAYLEDFSAIMLFRNVLFQEIEHLQYFNQKNLMDLETVSAIYQMIKLIRSNGWNGVETESDSERVADLKHLIAAYEEALDNVFNLDYVTLLQYAINTLKGYGADLANQLSFIFAAKISYLVEDTERYTGLEQEFLSLLQTGEENPVTLYEGVISLETLTSCKQKTSFFKGYGSFNEASYVANDILANQLPFGTVTVLYHAARQLPAIYSALQGNGIAMAVSNAHPAWDNAYIHLVQCILDWAQTDFAEKSLERILASTVLGVEVKNEEGKIENVLAKQSYFDYVQAARNRRNDAFVLGWGYERNKQFVAHEKAIVKKPEVLAILELHEKLLEIFAMPNGKEKPTVIYQKLLGFLKENAQEEMGRKEGMEKLRNFQEVVRFEEDALSLADNIQFLKQILSKASVSSTASEGQVLVQNLNDWVMLDRPNVYVIGLSLKEMQGSTTESPVLHDAEMEKYLKSGYIPTIENQAQLMEKNLFRTLYTFRGEKMVFGYSSYDTVAFCENNPSNFFRDALAFFDGKDIESLEEFVYGNPLNGNEIEYLPEDNLPVHQNIKVKLESSSSVLETLLDCPKKYAFSYVLSVPEEEFVEENHAAWLDSKQRGTFFHGIMEEYAKAKLIKPASKAYDPTVDEALVRGIADKFETEFLKQLPVAYVELANQETQNMVKIAIAFLQSLHAELVQSSWRVLTTEQHFHAAKYSVTAYDKKAYDFEFTGIIDRIDYCINKEQHTILIRLVDYKTGKVSSKKTSDTHGKAIQHEIYVQAVMNGGLCKDEQEKELPLLEALGKKIMELEGIQEDWSEWLIDFDSFQYVFPYENSGNNKFVLKTGDLCDVNLARLRTILTFLEGNKIYPDHRTLFDAISLYKDTYKQDISLATLYDVLSEDYKKQSVEEEKSCAYCSYASLCAKRKEMM